MALKPTEKSAGIEDFLTSLQGESRSAAIQDPAGPRCLRAPIGCGQPLGNLEEHFRDDLSLREYQISGLCQKCQDDVFGAPEEDDDVDDDVEEPPY